MSPDEASDLAARILAAIPLASSLPERMPSYAADRERVASDLAGVVKHQGFALDDDECYECATGNVAGCSDAARYADGLLRTGALYGVTP